MDKIDWKRKLTSRKFWIAVATFVTLILLRCGVTQTEAGQIAEIIMAGAVVIGYIIGEGLADGMNKSAEDTATSNTFRISCTDAIVKEENADG